MEKLCKIADPKSPLHRCDFSGSIEGGKALAKMLQLGLSVPWPDALDAFAGTKEMSVKPILSFFEPLKKWLENENRKNGDKIGWENNIDIRLNIGLTL